FWRPYFIMDATGWIIFFSAIITLAILIQAGALLGMFLHMRAVSRELEDFKTQMSGRINNLTRELQTQAHDLGDKASQTADIVKAEITRLERDIAQVRASAEETMSAVREIGLKAQQTVNRLLYILDTPARESQALSKGIQTGLRVLFNKPETPQRGFKRSA